MKPASFSTSPFADQKPGTAGLRKKVAVASQPRYIENFMQSVFDAAGDFRGTALVAGGDGRYYNDVALQTLAGLAAGNGVARLIIGRDGLLSTPAASNLIRRRGAAGGFLLTASHNPGGPDGDFGIKFNTSSGGQASEALMDRIHQATSSIERFLAMDIGRIDLGRTGVTDYGPLTVEVVDPVDDYAALMESLFDFDLIAELFKGGFSMRFDAMHAVTGPYAREILCERLGAPADWLLNAVPLPDFGAGHPDPNPVDAAALVTLMGHEKAPAFAAASDGDGDRNMIVGPGMVVSPGDSLAIITANASLVPGYQGGLSGVARSMPTSRAVDAVAADLGIPCYETPTGWRFFCNLLDDGRIDLCGEESFGTGSSHVREKDGLWAVLFWLNLIARTGRGVIEIVHEHWRRYGRNAFNREDFFIPDAQRGQEVMRHLEESVPSLAGRRFGDLSVERADVFEYLDPVDGSLSGNQGVRTLFDDGSRIVFRLSGTGTSGATLRVYLERRVTDEQSVRLPAAGLNAPLSAAGRSIARIRELTGIESPAAIV
jgi:phosphoglucomutase